MRNIKTGDKVRVLVGPRSKSIFDGLDGIVLLVNSKRECLVEFGDINTSWFSEDTLIRIGRIAAKGCVCGAGFTSNPDFHYKWCVVWEK